MVRTLTLCAECCDDSLNHGARRGKECLTYVWFLRGGIDGIGLSVDAGHWRSSMGLGDF